MKLIYFMRRADGAGPVKIGCSSHPGGRAKQLGSDMRATFEVLAEAPGDFILERNLHLKFARINEAIPDRTDRATPVPGLSEWFTATPELLAFIEQVKREGVITLAIDECRERVFAERYLGGETLQSIAEDFGVTRERVRQVLRATKVPSLGHRAEHRRCSVAEASAATVSRLAEAGKTVAEIAAEVGDNTFNVRNALKRRGIVAKRAKKPHRPETILLAHAVAADYQSGAKVWVIANRYGIPAPNIYRLLRIVSVEPTRLRAA